MSDQIGGIEDKRESQDLTKLWKTLIEGSKDKGEAQAPQAPQAPELGPQGGGGVQDKCSVGSG